MIPEQHIRDVDATRRDHRDRYRREKSFERVTGPEDCLRKPRTTIKSHLPRPPDALMDGSKVIIVSL